MENLIHKLFFMKIWVNGAKIQIEMSISAERIHSVAGRTDVPASGSIHIKSKP